jgi:hypothetical protein
MAGDWIKLHRKITESPIFAHDGLFRLWCYCLMRANWKESRWLVPGTLLEIAIPRGAFITGRESLSVALYGPDYRGDTKPASRTIWRWLETLESMGCISTRSVSNRCTIVTVCKYSTYQQGGDPDVQPHVQPVSNSCPTHVQPVSTIEECKEGKECNTSSTGVDGPPLVAARTRKAYTAAFESWWAAYPRKVGKTAAFKAYQRAVPHLAPERLLEVTKRFASSPAGRAGIYTPHPASWLNAGRYNDDPAEWQRTESQSTRTPHVSDPREQQKNDAEGLAFAIIKSGRRAQKPDEAIKAELTAAGLTWPS